MDAEITGWINALAGQSRAADDIMIGISQIGVPIIVFFVILQWWSQSHRSHVRHAAICAGLAFLLGLAINQGLLLFIHRLRPYDAGVSHLLIARSADWSFPSDHATASIAVAATFAIQMLPRRALLLFAIASLVCVSRVFIGTHYLTDILGGAATGGVAAMIVRLVYREGNRLDRIATRIF